MTMMTMMSCSQHGTQLKIICFPETGPCPLPLPLHHRRSHLNGRFLLAGVGYKHSDEPGCINFLLSAETETCRDLFLPMVLPKPWTLCNQMNASDAFLFRPDESTIDPEYIVTFKRLCERQKYSLSVLVWAVYEPPCAQHQRYTWSASWSSGYMNAAYVFSQYEYE